MIATISIEQANKMMEVALKDYSKRESSLIGHSINAGTVVGVFNVLSRLDGFPREKIEEYRLRIDGISELLTMR